MLTEDELDPDDELAEEELVAGEPLPRGVTWTTEELAAAG